MIGLPGTSVAPSKLDSRTYPSQPTRAASSSVFDKSDWQATKLDLPWALGPLRSPSRTSPKSTAFKHRTHRTAPHRHQTLASLMLSRVYIRSVGRCSRSVRARRQAAQATESAAGDQRAAGRDQAYQEAYERAQERAGAPRASAGAASAVRGSCGLRSERGMDAAAARAAERDQPASAYLGELVRAHLAERS